MSVPKWLVPLDKSLLPGIDPFDGLDDTPACAYCEAA